MAYVVSINDVIRLSVNQYVMKLFNYRIMCRLIVSQIVALDIPFQLALSILLGRWRRYYFVLCGRSAAVDSLLSTTGMTTCRRGSPLTCSPVTPLTNHHWLFLQLAPLSLHAVAKLINIFRAHLPGVLRSMVVSHSFTTAAKTNYVTCSAAGEWVVSTH